MVAVIETRAQWLREALGPDKADVLFVDMAQLGRNPARIIPAWRQFLGENSAHGDPVRGIGEPIWSGRRPEEIVECQLHEAMLNVAVKPDTPFWLMCPYDANQLSESVIEEMYRSHPAVVAAGQYRGSHLYGGRDYADIVCSSALPLLDGLATELSFGRGDLDDLSSLVTASALGAGVSRGKAADLAVAVQELVSGSVHRGARGGVVRIWTRSDAVIFEVHDDSLLGDALGGHKLASRDQRNGLWTANQLCDLVQVRSTTSGTTVRVLHWL